MNYFYSDEDDTTISLWSTPTSVDVTPFKKSDEEEFETHPLSTDSPEMTTIEKMTEYVDENLATSTTTKTTEKAGFIFVLTVPRELDCSGTKGHALLDPSCKRDCMALS